MTNAEKDIRLLTRVGTFMFGERWQSDLTRALKVNGRTTRRWYSGKSRIQTEYWESILRSAEKHAAVSKVIVEVIRRRVKEGRERDEREERMAA